MINYLGKGLVLLTVALSVLFLAWSIGIYTQTIDWGWKDPRKHLGERVPSEIDKRIAAVTQGLRFKVRAQESVKDAAKSLAEAEQDFPENVLSFREKLAELRSGEGKIKVVELKYDKGVLVRKSPRATAEPVYDAVVPGAEKSVAGYLNDLNKVQSAIDAVTAEIRKLNEQEKELTVKLNDQKDEKGNVVKVGIYGLLDIEKKRQDQVAEEMEYLRPLWLKELVDTQSLRDWTERLDQRLRELQRLSRAPQTR
jgi:hypothetical protein